MNKELEILIDGFNPHDGRVYEVQHVLEHHYYVVSRQVSLDMIKKFEKEHGRIQFLDDAARAFCAVSVFGNVVRKEFSNDVEANKYWSQCMLLQGALF